MNPSTPTCQLEDFHMTRLHLDWVDPAREEVNIEATNSRFDYDVFSNREHSRYFMMKFQAWFQQVDENRNKVGYQVECETLGIFEISEEIPEESWSGVIRLNGLSILYGILRGQLANATGSFPNGKLLIPTIMPKDIIQMVEEQEKRNAKKEASNGTAGKPAKKSKRKTGTKKAVKQKRGKEK